MLRNVNAICIFPKNVVYLYSEEERAHKHRGFSSFLAQNDGCFSSVIRKFLVASGFFLSASGSFLSAVVARAGLSRQKSGSLIIKNIKVGYYKL